MTRTAPRARCSAGPARPSQPWPWSRSRPLRWAGPSAWAGGQGVLFRFVFLPPHIFISLILFVSLALGVGLLQLAGFQTFGQIALTDPNPEQKSRRGSPSLRTQPPASRSPEGSGLPQARRQGRSCLQGLPACPSAGAGRGVEFHSTRASLDPLPLLLLTGKASSPEVFREGSETG